VVIKCKSRVTGANSLNRRVLRRVCSALFTSFILFSLVHTYKASQPTALYKQISQALISESGGVEPMQKRKPLSCLLTAMLSPLCSHRYALTAMPILATLVLGIRMQLPSLHVFPHDIPLGPTGGYWSEFFRPRLRQQPYIQGVHGKLQLTNHCRTDKYADL
jgi:hypothetical protein